MLDNIEKKLGELPKGRLDKRADFRIRCALYKKMAAKEFTELRAGWALPKFNYAPAAAAILLLALVVSIPGYAYASVNVTAGHLLYPVKQTVENIELKLAAGEEKKAETYAKLAERRLDEAEVLSKKEEASKELTQTINEAVRLTGQAKIQAENIAADEEREQVEAKLNQAASKDVDKLKAIASQVGISAEEELVDSIALSLDAFKKNLAKKEEKLINPPSILFPEAEEASTTASIGLKEEVTSYAETASSAEPAAEEAQTNNSPRTRNAESAREKIEEKATQKINAEIITPEENLNEIKSKIENLRTELHSDGFEPGDVETLFNRLDQKLEKAEQSIQADQGEKFAGLLNSTWALTNNAKHFIRSKQNANSTNSSQEETEKENNSSIQSSELNSETQNGTRNNNNSNNRTRNR